jgi:hypothetical protein
MECIGRWRASSATLFCYICQRNRPTLTFLRSQPIANRTQTTLILWARALGSRPGAVERALPWERQRWRARETRW